MYKKQAFKKHDKQRLKMGAAGIIECVLLVLVAAQLGM